MCIGQIRGYLRYVTIAIGNMFWSTYVAVSCRRWPASCLSMALSWVAPWVFSVTISHLPAFMASTSDRNLGHFSPWMNRTYASQQKLLTLSTVSHCLFTYWFTFVLKCLTYWIDSYAQLLLLVLLFNTPYGSIRENHTVNTASVSFKLFCLSFDKTSLILAYLLLCTEPYVYGGSYIWRWLYHICWLE